MSLLTFSFPLLRGLKEVLELEVGKAAQSPVHTLESIVGDRLLRIEIVCRTEPALDVMACEIPGLLELLIEPPHRACHTSPQMERGMAKVCSDEIAELHVSS